MEPYELKRGNFKNLTLRLRSDGTLRVSAPHFVPKVLIDRFVRERAEWIAERRTALSAARRPEDSPLTTVSVWGVRHEVRIQSPGRLPRVVHNPEQKLVTLHVPATWTQERQQRALDDWEKERVIEALERLVPAWSARMGLPVDRWTVKRLRSRWGSCRPSTRSLVFNARLGSLPPECLEHVVVHELVHLIELSHNARFHALVEHWLPGSNAVRAMLKRGTPPVEPGASPSSHASGEAETEPRGLRQ